MNVPALNRRTRIIIAVVAAVVVAVTALLVARTTPDPDEPRGGVGAPASEEPHEHRDDPAPTQSAELEAGDFSGDAEEGPLEPLPDTYHDGYVNGFVTSRFTRGPDDTIFDQWARTYPLMTPRFVAQVEADLDANREQHDAADAFWSTQGMAVSIEMVAVNYFGQDDDGRYQVAVTYRMVTDLPDRQQDMRATHDLHLFLVEHDGGMAIDEVDDRLSVLPGVDVTQPDSDV